MADNFFDGTLDDFLDDQALFELAGLALPLHSPLPARSVLDSPIRSAPLAPPSLFNSRSRRGLGNSLELFDQRIREPPTLPSDIQGAAHEPGPSRSGAFHRPTPAALWRPELSRLHAPRRNLDNSSPTSFQPNSPTHPTPASATLTPGRSAFVSALPLHGLPNLSAASNPRQRSRNNFPSEARARACARDLPHISPQRQNSHRNHTGGIADTVYFNPALGFPRRGTTERAIPAYDSDSISSGSATMSSNSRRRSVRPGDLVLPSAPSQPSPPSRSGARTTRRSTSRPLQPERNTSTTKRKREPDDDDDIFGDKLFADHDVVDLVDKDEIPAEVLNSQERNKNFVKLSRFDCVICMDSVKDLTVTHCGHLFCSECLHSALNMDPIRRICPICRQKIEKLPATGKFGQRAKGFYPLELKLTTRSTLGKKPQSSQPTG